MRTVWPVHNPYLGIDSPSFPPAADGFLDPADFCYRTTMRTSAFNWAYLFLPFVASVVICLTIWFPIRLWRTVERIRPRPDGFTELGEVRRDLDIEYERLLERDESPLCVHLSSSTDSAYTAQRLPVCYLSQTLERIQVNLVRLYSSVTKANG